MESVTGTPGSIVDVLQALIVMFVAAPPLIRAMYRLRTTRAAGVSQVLSRGGNA
jgi:simple sugar transport system permease protein